MINRIKSMLWRASYVLAALLTVVSGCRQKTVHQEEVQVYNNEEAKILFANSLKTEKTGLPVVSEYSYYDETANRSYSIIHTTQRLKIYVAIDENNQLLSKANVPSDQVAKMINNSPGLDLDIGCITICSKTGPGECEAESCDYGTDGECAGGACAGECTLDHCEGSKSVMGMGSRILIY